MARGGQGVLKSTLQGEQQNAQQQQQEGQQLFGTLNQSYTDVAKNPVSSAEKNAITQGTLQPLAESFDASQNTLGNRAARTRNEAGFTAGLDKLAQTRGQETAQANMAVQGKLSDMEFNRRMEALKQQQGLYGTATGAGLGYSGQAAGTANQLSQRQAAPGFWGTLLNKLQATPSGGGMDTVGLAAG